MKNKLLILAIFITNSFVCAQAQDIVPNMEEAISKYKAKNYVGCMQDTLDISQNDPSNALAHYYLAISYAQLGNKEKAIEAYQKVINLATSETLKEYAQRGELCLNSPEECQRNATQQEISDKDLHKFINSTKHFSKEVTDKLDEIELEMLKYNINKDADLKSETPSNDEIAQAVKTLAKAGFNPLAIQNNSYTQANQSMMQNPEYMQLQMLLGNNQSNTNTDFMSMMPYFFQQNNSSRNSEFSAETIKNMMMSSMIGNLNTTFDFNDK